MWWRFLREILCCGFLERVEARFEERGIQLSLENFYFSSVDYLPKLWHSILDLEKEKRTMVVWKQEEPIVQIRNPHSCVCWTNKCVKYNDHSQSIYKKFYSLIWFETGNMLVAKRFFFMRDNNDPIYGSNKYCRRIN